MGRTLRQGGERQPAQPPSRTDQVFGGIERNMAEHARENPEDPNSRNSMMGVAKRALGLDQPNSAPSQPDAVDRAIEGALQRLSEGDVRLARQIADGMIPAIEAGRRAMDRLDAFGDTAVSLTPGLNVVANGFEAITGNSAYDGSPLSRTQQAAAILGVATMGLSSTFVKSTVAVTKAVNVARGIKAVQRVDQMANVLTGTQGAVSDLGVLADSSASGAERAAAALRLSLLGRSVNSHVSESVARAEAQRQQGQPPARPSNDNASAPRPPAANDNAARVPVPPIPAAVARRNQEPVPPRLSPEAQRIVVAEMQRRSPMPAEPAMSSDRAAQEYRLDPAVRAAQKVRLNDLRVDDVGYNVSALHVDGYPSIGAGGRTYVTDRRAVQAILSRARPGQREITLTVREAHALAVAMGVGRAEYVNGFKVRRIEGLSRRNVLSPTVGNGHFQGFENGLPGGHPELVVDGVATHDGNGVTTELVVRIRRDG